MSQANGVAAIEIETPPAAEAPPSDAGGEDAQPQPLIAYEDLPWQQIAEAKVHPLQIRILKVYIAGGIHSPNSLSEDFNLSLNIIAYHVRALRELDLIKLHDTKQRRGATEHLYVFNLKAKPPSYLKGKSAKDLKTRDDGKKVKAVSAKSSKAGRTAS
ncbi:MAG TPA: helix-turn-helix domain-containing protein [Candidatus Saccharimonadales bacterium]|nr:helix-turn-helix domain-containing protein [Candidatus Saccharimonadales bacterium]